MPTAELAPPSRLRAWYALVTVSLQRQFRLRQMGVIAVGLMMLAVVVVGLITWNDAWGFQGMNARRLNQDQPRENRLTHREALVRMTALSEALPLSPEAGTLERVIAGSYAAMLRGSGFFLLSRVLITMFVGFLLPLWTLAFATDAFGGEREARTILWILSRPLPRAAIYLAKYCGALPWCLLLNIGGFAAICFAAGTPGRLAFQLYWPAVTLGTLAFTSLFVLFGAAFRLPTVVGLLYCFFLEIIVAQMPGAMRRASVAYYVRSMMLDAGSRYGLQPINPAVEIPLSTPVAASVLLGLTGVLLCLGMVLFSRWEYREDV